MDEHCAVDDWFEKFELAFYGQTGNAMHALTIDRMKAFIAEIQGKADLAAGDSIAVCADCGLQWRGAYTDCPGCQAQAGMKAVSDLLQEQKVARDPLIAQLEDLIRWTLGEHETDEFPSLPDDWPVRKFYWRAELRKRFDAVLARRSSPTTGDVEK